MFLLIFSETFCEAEKNEISQLEQDLLVAQEELRKREQYDELAKPIMSKGLRSRTEQQESIGKLQDAIRELEEENANYVKAWNLRKDIFDETLKQMNHLQSILHPPSNPESDSEEGIASEGENPSSSSSTQYKAK